MVIGGILDFKLFFSDEQSTGPEDAIQLYHEYIGGFGVPPFWSLGYH
jgi:lysosomal alpha-glucosidase